MPRRLTSDGGRIADFMNIVGEPMPFFLVTHRSLIEADSDREAAVRALEKIENTDKLAFEVRLDEANITHVVLDARRVEREPSENDERLASSEQREVLIAPADAGQHLMGSSPPAGELMRPDKATAAIVAIFLGSLVLMTLLFGSL